MKPLYWPQRKWTVLIFTLLWLLSSLMIVLSSYPPKGGSYDYPIAVLSGARVAAGETPFLDFLALYGPFQHLLLGWLMASFPSAPPAQVANIFFTIPPLILTTCALVGSCRLHLSQQGWLSVLVSVYIILLSPFLGYGSSYSSYPSLLCVVLALVASYLWQTSYSFTFRLCAAIMLAAISFLTIFWRFNFGIYTVAAMSAAFCWALIVQKGDRRIIAAIGVAYFIVLGALSMWYLSTPLGSSFAQSIQEYIGRFGFRKWNLFQTIESSHLILAEPFIFLIILSLVGAASFRTLQFRSGPQIVVLLGLALCFLHYLYTKTDYLHAYSLVCLLPFLCLQIGRDAFTVGPRLKRMCLALQFSAMASLLVVILGYTALSANFLYSQRGYWLRLFQGHEQINIRNHHGTPYTFDLKVLDELRNNLGINGTIFWMAKPGFTESPHDLGISLSFYLLDGNLPKGRIWFFDPPFTSFPEAHKVIIEDLDTSNVENVVVLSERPPGLDLSHENPKEPTLVYDFVRGHFKHERTFRSEDGLTAYDLYTR